MKCLSLWQPWASLMAVGAKRIETRSWDTSYRGPLAIHAAKVWNKELARFAFGDEVWPRIGGGTVAPATKAKLPLDHQFVPRGCIVAVVNLVAVSSTNPNFRSPEVWRVAEQERAFGDYRPYRYMWLTADVVPLSVPVPMVGHQGLFNVPPDTLMKLEAQIAEDRATHQQKGKA